MGAKIFDLLLAWLKTVQQKSARESKKEIPNEQGLQQPQRIVWRLKILKSRHVLEDETTPRWRLDGLHDYDQEQEVKLNR